MGLESDQSLQRAQNLHFCLFNPKLNPAPSEHASSLWSLTSLRFANWMGMKLFLASGQIITFQNVFFVNMTQRHEVTKCGSKNGAKRIVLLGVTTNLQCVKAQLSVKHNKAKHHKMRYSYSNWFAELQSKSKPFDPNYNGHFVNKDHDTDTIPTVHNVLSGFTQRGDGFS